MSATRVTIANSVVVTPIAFENGIRNFSYTEKNVFTSTNSSCQSSLFVCLLFICNRKYERIAEHCRSCNSSSLKKILFDIAEDISMYA